MFNGRSREGAWIEINYSPLLEMIHKSRSREGAWIEMPTLDEADYEAADAVGRSREGAWIEMPTQQTSARPSIVAPVRERGLKYGAGQLVAVDVRSLP